MKDYHMPTQAFYENLVQIVRSYLDDRNNLNNSFWGLTRGRRRIPANAQEDRIRILTLIDEGNLSKAQILLENYPLSPALPLLRKAIIVSQYL